MSNGTRLIAVVDDEFAVRRALWRLLRANGYRVETYATAELLLGALATQDFDCVLLDLHLPGLSGLEALYRIEARAGALPVIVITGDSTPEVRKRALAARAADCLFKPVDVAVLLASIERALPGPVDRAA
jgi:FixJ family two-component response regulator